MSRYATCSNCGRRLHRLLDDFGCWDGESYICYHCESEYDDDDDDGEYLSVYEAADIWRSNGFDEDYTFGYSEEELEDALS